METNTFLLVLSLLLGVVVALMVPLALKLMKTLQSLNDLLATTEESIKPILLEAGEITKKANSIVSSFETVASEVRKVAEPIGAMGAELRKVKDALGFVGQLRGKATALGAAAGITAKVLREGLFRKRSGPKSPGPGPIDPGA